LIASLSGCLGSGGISVKGNRSKSLAIDNQAPAFSSELPEVETGAPVLAGDASPSAPKIFNHSGSAQPGDIIYIQGANFTSDAKVLLTSDPSAPGSELRIVNRVGSTYVAAEIPSSGSGAMFLRVTNASGRSAAASLNGPVLFHTDTLELTPSGKLRIFGKNLMSSGNTPSVSINGKAATIELSASNENQLALVAPADLAVSSQVSFLVNNGNGSGSVASSRPAVIVAGSGDPFQLKVSWGAALNFNDRLLPVTTPCNGTADDTAAIEAKLNAVTATGAVVVLPAGTCRITRGLSLKSKTVLQGAGKSSTIVSYEANFPIYAENKDSIGLKDLTFRNARSVVEGVHWVK
ncbi:MAG: hypothetical protein EOP09_19575, partial [Proteobacteria bacterium]